jgi:hypothetical protein
LDYKNFIRRRDTRLRVLKALDFIPDPLMLRLQYFAKTRRALNLNHPMRYTEKIQWYKLNYRDPLITTCSDKLAVRDYVQSKGLGSILNEYYEVFHDAEAIQFSALPTSFALKCTNGSGVNYFVNNKAEVSEREVKNHMAAAIAAANPRSGREWGYYGVPESILAERLLPRDENNDIPDYKFFCFQGKVEFLYVMKNYVDDHAMGECSFFTKEFEKLPYRRSEYRPIEGVVRTPANFDRMVEIAEILAADFPHVRVDLYNQRGEITFGELTFYPASGYSVFTPDEFDFIMGAKFQLPSRASSHAAHQDGR